uniref:hypothetical protein n=1 Tax=Streptomyces rochei TaxID=1928 RepID=UPI0015E87756|nr:hypothetical protein [Streptomyces rochei]
MTSAAEQKLTHDYGWPLEEVDFGREDEPDVGGCLLARQVPTGVQVRIVIRPGLAGDDRDTFAAWALQLVERFIEHGPEGPQADGWQKRSDGDWQLWGRVHDLPPLD